MAISSEFRGMRLANFFFSDLISLFISKEITNFRIDTGKENKIVQHIAIAHNFKKRGIILVEDPIDPHRFAYELNL